MSPESSSTWICTGAQRHHYLRRKQIRSKDHERQFTQFVHLLSLSLEQPITTYESLSFVYMSHVDFES